MKQIIQNLNNGSIELEEVPIPKIKSGHILIQTTYSLISAGTEKMLLNFGKSGYIGKAMQQPEKLKEVINKAKNEGLFNTWETVQNKLSQPIPLGYSNIGVVVEVSDDVKDFKIGQRVVSNGNHSEIVLVPKNLCVHLPDNVSDIDASFTILGSIGLQGTRLANPTLGETIVVSGLGIIGLLTAQILLAQGCKVIGIDIDQKKCDLANDLGIEAINLNTSEDPISSIMGKTNYRGVDGVIITAATSSNDPIDLAAKICRQRGRIILVGVTGLELNRDLFYKKELTFQVSCSYGPGRYDPKYEIEGIDYPLGLVRWTEKRNMETIVDLISSKKIIVDKLITHKFNLYKFQNAYDLLESKEFFLGILLKYPNKINSQKTILISKNNIINLENKKSTKIEPIVNFLGSGNYASNILIPLFYKERVNLFTISANNGLSPTRLAKKFKFKKATTDSEECFRDKTANTIVICTRHDSHFEYIIRALENDKNIFIEKPICLSLKELESIKKTYYQKFSQNKSKILMVGYNRRFSQLAIKMKDHLNKLQGPKSIIYTCNAGYIDSNNWIHNKKIGGGRLIGEACHFVDFVRFLVDSKITKIEKQSLNKSFINNDTFNLNIDFEDGSIASINYITLGSKMFPKERIEVFSNGSVIRLDNFKKLQGWGLKNFNNINLFNQDKGQRNCIRNFIESIKYGLNSPIPFNEIIETQELLLSIEE